MLELIVVIKRALKLGLTLPNTYVCLNDVVFVLNMFFMHSLNHIMLKHVWTEFILQNYVFNVIWTLLKNID